jgi:hypothetical protein
MNSDKIILDLCGGTGSWSKPYKDAGYDVRLITLPEWDVRGFIIDSCPDGINPYKIYGILAAPPCTQFSLARTTAKTPRNFHDGMDIVRACLQIIWSVAEWHTSGCLKFWALENPRGYLRKFLGKPAFSFYQWEFGDNGIKPTDLWGNFNDPVKTVKIKPNNLSKKFPNGSTNAKNWSKSAEKRAITPYGFAQAFFEVNQENYNSSLKSY